MRKLLTKENLLILLLIGLFGHNIFLQTRIEKAIKAAKDAEYEARNGTERADEAASYASDAADYANETSRKALC